MARFKNIGGQEIPFTQAEEDEFDALAAAKQVADAQYASDLADGTIAENKAIAGYDGDLETPITYKDLKAFAQALKDQFATLDLTQLRADYIARRKALK
jgi:hypothetical protein